MLFLSHATEDANIARHVCDQLEQAGLNCWIAGRDAPPGKDYGQVIVSAIGASKGVVLLLSTHANKSPFVAKEIERAVAKEKPIYTLRLQGVRPEGSLEFFVSSGSWIDVEGNDPQGSVRKLIEAIRKLPPSAPKAKSKRRNWMGWLLGASVSILVFASLWVYFGPRLTESSEPQQVAKRYLDKIDKGQFESVYRRLVSDAFKPTLSREAALAQFAQMRAARAGGLQGRELLFAEPKRRWDILTGHFVLVRFESTYSASASCDDLWLREEHDGWKVYQSMIWERPARGCATSEDVASASAVAERFLREVDAANTNAIYPELLTRRLTDAYDKLTVEPMLNTMRGWTGGTVNSRSVHTAFPIGAYGAIPGDFVYVRFKTVGAFGVIYEDIHLERTKDDDWRVANFVGSPASN